MLTNNFATYTHLINNTTIKFINTIVLIAVKFIFLFETKKKKKKKKKKPTTSSKIKQTSNYIISIKITNKRYNKQYY